MDSALQAQCEAARGFMPPDEGLALYNYAQQATNARPTLALLEIGSYCGKSALYIGAAAAEANTVLFALDHHRGSEENQAGWEFHEPDLVDESLGVMDTLPIFRNTVYEAGLEKSVVALVGESATISRFWTTPLGFLFIDGGHGAEPAHRDYERWTPHVAIGGTLCIHDVFENPADGGRPPYEIFRRAIESNNFEERAAVGSLRVLTRIDTAKPHVPESKVFS